MTMATPLNVTVTGPLGPLEHPLDLDWNAFRVTLPDFPVMVPVPVNGSHWAEAEAVPLPLTVLVPIRVAKPLPLTETMLTEPLLMSNETVPR